jgi:hypothetical protein
MYNDDFFSPTRDNDYDKNTPSTTHFDQKYLNEMKKADKNYFAISIKKGKKIEYYSSNGIGSTIRNATTGKYYTGQLVGSSSENQFFKAKIMIKGVKEVSLYYNTPEEYERHFNVLLNNKTKELWRNKNIINI